MFPGVSYRYATPVERFPGTPIEMIFPGAPNYQTPPIDSYSRYYAQQRHH